MSFACTNTTRLHVTGTSLTQTNLIPGGNWHAAPGGLFDQIRAKAITFPPVPPFNYLPARANQAVPLSYSPLAQSGRRQVLTAFGVGGRAMSNLQVDIANSVTIWNPDILVIEMGTNDFSAAVGVGGIGSAYAIATASVIDQVHAALPSCKILVPSVTVCGETTAAGPHFFDGTDTWLGNSDVQLVIAANGRSAFCEYVDWITPALAYCVANNTPFPGGSSPRYLTQDNKHQSNLGKVLMANAVMSHLTFK